MGKDWDEPRDKGPQIEEPVNRYRKSRKGKKKFTIESRRNPYVERPKWGWFYNLLREDWKVMSRYRTEKARDEAWKNLIKKYHSHGLMSSYYRMQQFRKGSS